MFMMEYSFGFLYLNITLAISFLYRLGFKDPRILDF